MHVNDGKKIVYFYKKSVFVWNGMWIGKRNTPRHKKQIMTQKIRSLCDGYVFKKQGSKNCLLMSLRKGCTLH